VEGVLHIVELERLDDGFDLLHPMTMPNRRRIWKPRGCA
jgi:hypothetical protein